MKMPKPTDEDLAFFRDVFEDRENVRIKPMFGNIAAFVQSNDQMCAGLFGSNLGLRLDDERLEALRAQEGSGPFGPAGRPMRAYAVLPAAWRGDADTVEEWVAAAVTHTASLPPKKKKKAKKKKS